VVSVSEQVLFAVIAATPPTAAAVLGVFAYRRSLKTSVGRSPGVSLVTLLEHMESRFESRFDRIETKIDILSDRHGEARERLARLEAEELWPEGRRR
jgi:hypothetical protein